MPTNTTIGNASGTYDIVAGTHSVIRVGNGADTVDVSGGAGSTITIGNGLDDVLATDGSGNLITVGNGNDTITLSGGSGNTVTAGSGNVVVNTSGESDDKITVGGGIDTIIAGADSTITASSAGGNDTITAGAGSTINGGGGNDAITAGASSAITDGNGADTITAGGGSVISAGAGNDKVTVTGGSGARIELGDGNDTVTVSAGSANTITLGGGNDVVNASGEANDKIALGNGVDTVSAGADSVIAAGGGNDTITAGDNSVITTNDGESTLSFGGLTLNIATSGGGDAITAGANSSITAGDGNDTITAGSGSTIKAGNGADTIVAGAGSSITAGSATDSISLFGVTLAVTIADGNDTITAGDDSTIVAGDGNDTITAGAGSKITVGAISNTVSLAGLTLDIGGENGADTITAGANSVITAGNGAVTVNAGNSDIVTVGNGNDAVFMGASDTVAAGSGKDTFAVGTSGTPTVSAPAALTLVEGGSVALPISASLSPAAFGQDVITGFIAGKDVLQFSTSQFANAAAVLADAQQVGQNTVISVDAADAITLENVSKSILNASDFAFIGGAPIGSGAATVTISGIPSNVSLSNAGGALAITNGSVTLTAAQLAGLTLQAADAANASLTVTAVNATTGASTSQILALTVDQAAPVLAGATSDTVTEGGPVTLGASAAAAFGDDTLGAVTITGLPTDLGAGSFNGGTYTASSGTWTGSAAQFNALTFAALTAGTSTLSISATTAGADAGAAAAESYTLTVDQAAPVLSGATSGTVTEGGEVPFGATDAAAFGDDTLGNVTITGLPTDLSAGSFNGGTYTASSGTWTGSAAEFNALTFAALTAGTSTLAITETTAGTDAGAPTTASYTLTVDQAAPVLGGATSDTVTEGGTAALGATDAAAFGDDTLGAVTITGLPTDLGASSFNGGTYTASSGTWTGSAAQFNALTFAALTAGTSTLAITATTTGTDAGASATASYTLTVDQAAPVLGGATSDTVTEGGAVTLGATDAAAFGDDTLGNVTITGLPIDLSAGSFNGGTYTASSGTWTGSAAQFNALTFAALTAGTSTLAITATTAGADAGAAAAESYTLTVDQAAPQLGGATSKTTTEGAVTLGATDTAAFDDDTLGNVTITGLSSSASNFNGGAYTAATGTWMGTAAQFNALSFTANAGTYTLGISAATTGADAGAAATESYTLTVDQAKPVLTGATSQTLTEGVAIALGITDIAAFSDDTLGNVTITGLYGHPANFNGGAYTAATGTWTGTAAQFNALSYTEDSGTYSLDISAGTTGTDPGAAANLSYSLTIDQGAPVLGGATSDTVTEGGTVTLGATDSLAFPDDVLGNVTITGLPADLSGFNGGAYTAATGAWTGTEQQFNALKFTTATAGTSTLSVSATTSDADPGAPATETYTLTVDQAAPKLAGATSDTVTEGGPVTLGASAAAAFGDDTLGAVTITGLPTDLGAGSFNGGTYTASSGTWTGSAAQFNALTFAALTAGTSTLAISATTAGADAGAPATESYTLTVNQAAPVLSGATSGTVTEGGEVPFGATDAAAFGDDTPGNVTITGLPTDLSAGSFNGGTYTASSGTWTGSAAQFSALTFAALTTGTSALSITATTAGTDDGAAATASYTLTVDQAAPVLGGATSDTVTEGGDVTLGATVAAAFGDDKLGNVTITGLPTDLSASSFNGGTYTASNGTWTGSAAQFSALQFTAATAGTSTLSISATTAGTDPGASATETYSLTVNAPLKALISFNANTGYDSQASFLVDANGDLFGTTFAGGPNADGSVFELKNTGTVAAPSYSSTPTDLVAIIGNNEGPAAGLVADANGDLFGTTFNGGGNADTYLNDGQVFELQNTGAVAAPSYSNTATTLVAFNSADGQNPSAGLIVDANGDLFGTTSQGGANGDGTVFELQNTGAVAAPSYSGTPITLISFNGTNGDPVAGLIADANGDLFGTTEGTDFSGGTVFELKNTGTVAAPSYSGTPTTLVSFNGTNGADPEAGLVADANGDLFGTTTGGANGGTVFELKNTGSLAAPIYSSTPITLVSFNETDGDDPQAGLIVDANGDLFGTTAGGGANDLGTAFEIVNQGSVAAPIYSGAPITLVSFNQTTGYAPQAGLTADANGDLFGTTTLGGANGEGTAFEITDSGFVPSPPPVLGGAPSASVTEGNLVTLGATDTAATSGEALGDVTITGLPTSSSNFNGGSFANGVWTGSAAQFDALTFAALTAGTSTLSITATTAGADAGAAATESYTLTVDQAAPVLGGATSDTVTEGGVVTLGASDAAAFGDDTLGNVTITGLPTDLSAGGFNGGTYTAASGTWTGSAAQFNALTFAAVTAGTSTLSISATTTGADAGAPATESYALTVDQAAPVLGGATSDTVAEGGTVTLGASVAAAFGDDTPGDVTITGLPTNLSANSFSGGTYTASTGTWTGSAAQFNALSFTAGGPSTATLTISATTTGANAGEPTTETYALNVDQASPVLGGATSTSIDEGASVMLGATDTAAFSDDTLGNVTITGLPSNLTTFNGGAYTAATGTWIGAAAQFNALTFNTGRTAGPSTLTISAATSGLDAGAPATENYTLSVDAPVLTNVVAFNDGGSPSPGMIVDAEGDLLGTASAGGVGNDGTVFEVFNNGTVSAPSYAATPTVLAAFTSGDGINPISGLISDANGDLLGTTLLGGASNDGTVFEIKNNGTVSAPSYATTPTVLASLTGANGSDPSALVSDANGDLFGATELGGADSDGTVFEIKNNGTVSAPSYATTPIVLVSFTGADGSEPVAGLFVDADGDLLGTTVIGGTNEDGTVFDIVNDGTVAAPSYATEPADLARFGDSNGANPSGALIADAKGDLFGTTTLGGASDDGTVFEIKNNGTVAAPRYATAPTVLVSFTGSNGESPARSLIVDANGDLFGTTTGGGASSDGTVFEIVNNGTVAAPSYANTPDTLINFTVSGEGDQRSGLTVDANGDLFGTTATAIFEITNTGFVEPDPHTIANGASFEIASASEDAVTFGGATGTLQLDQSQSFVGTVAGFGNQDRIDFGDIAYGADTTLEYTANSSNTLGVLNLSDGVHTASITLLGQYSAASFAIASDGHGGTMLTEPALAAQSQLTQQHA